MLTKHIVFTAFDLYPFEYKISMHNNNYYMSWFWIHINKTIMHYEVVHFDNNFGVKTNRSVIYPNNLHIFLYKIIIIAELSSSSKNWVGSHFNFCRRRLDGIYYAHQYISSDNWVAWPFTQFPLFPFLLSQLTILIVSFFSISLK